MKVDKSKFICELDGYNYYLGDVVAKNVDWYEASILVSKLGDGWELPNRVVAMAIKAKFPEDKKPAFGWYWLEDEQSSMEEWYQGSTGGNQLNYYKTYTIGSYVRPVYKEKVGDKPKIKLLRIAGYSDLVLDINGEKVLYALGNDSAIGRGGRLIKQLDTLVLDVWYYEVVHEDFVEWLSLQQESKNTTKDFKKVFHIREKSEDGEVLARGGATVVFAETDSGFAAHVALCHPDDNYNKKVGVEVALSKNCYFKLPEVSDKFVRDTAPDYWKRVVNSK